MEQLKRAADEARTGGDWRGMGGVFLLLSPEQREMFMRMQALMSLLEGHASFVMNEVARDHVNDVDHMRRALSARRKASSLERTMQKAIGFEQKIRQYDTGEHFVRTIVDRAGMSTFNLVWRSPGDLPTLDEIGDPTAGSRGWAASRSHAPTAARRPGTRTGDGDGPRARDVPAGAVGPGRRLGRTGLRVPVGVARSTPTSVQDHARGLPLRSSPPEGLRGGRCVRGAPGGAPLPAVPPARGDVVAAQGRVGRGVGARAAALRDRGGHARDRGRPDGDRAHAGRPGRDDPHGAGDGERHPGDERHRARDRHVGQPIARRHARGGRGVLSLAPPATARRIRRTRTPGSCATPIRLRGLPALERAVGQRACANRWSGPRSASARTPTS